VESRCVNLFASNRVVDSEVLHCAVEQLHLGSQPGTEPRFLFEDKMHFIYLHTEPDPVFSIEKMPRKYTSASQALEHIKEDGL
jgi:hypothetical protein